MNTNLFATIYAAALHVCAVAAIVVLMAMGKVDPNTGVGILGGLLGFAVGVPVTVAATKTASIPDAPPAPTPVAPVTPAPVVPAAPVTPPTA